MTAPAALTPRKWLLATAASALVLAVVMLLAVVADPRALRGQGGHVSTSDAVRALAGSGDAATVLIVRRIRLPRVLVAALAGAALAEAGAALQLLLRNPLADPFVLGVSSGAALASVLGLAAGVSLAGGAHPAAAAAGALAAALVVHAIARDRLGRIGVERMVLAGVVLSYLLSAGVMWVISLSPAQEGQRYLFWLMGSFESASGAEAVVLAVVLLAGTALLMAVLPALNLVMVSESHAADAGVEVERVKLVTFVAAALLTGGSVAVAGSIGFVGLVVPHAVRLETGTDARLSATLSAVAGAGFLVVADTLARALGEVPVGVVTASCGAPFFLFLLARRRPG